MKFVAISDVHIKEEGDLSEKLFLTFLDHHLTRDSDAIFLLGDIFDLVVGSHPEYMEMNFKVFHKIAEQIMLGKKVYQFEGNHDFHFEELVSLVEVKFNLKTSSWYYCKEPLIKTIEGKQFMFAHGDEIEIENPGYQKYRKIIRSFPIKFLANKIVPYNLIKQIGVSASRKSRERNKSRYEAGEENLKIKERFRNVFREEKNRNSLDYLICGHSHCQDFYKEMGAVYSNNGYFPKTQTFTYFDGRELSQVKLD